MFVQKIVADIGSNTGWFSQLSASLGYDVHAIDVQPLCSRHVLTSAIANNFQELIKVHNVGLSSTPGQMQMYTEQCKGGLSFDTSKANEEHEVKIHGQVRKNRIRGTLIERERDDRYNSPVLNLI